MEVLNLILLIGYDYNTFRSKRKLGRGRRAYYNCLIWWYELLHDRIDISKGKNINEEY